MRSFNIYLAVVCSFIGTEVHCSDAVHGGLPAFGSSAYQHLFIARLAQLTGDQNNSEKIVSGIVSLATIAACLSEPRTLFHETRARVRAGGRNRSVKSCLDELLSQLEPYLEEFKEQQEGTCSQEETSAFSLLACSMEFLSKHLEDASAKKLSVQE